MSNARQILNEESPKEFFKRRGAQEVFDRPWPFSRLRIGQYFWDGSNYYQKVGAESVQMLFVRRGRFSLRKSEPLGRPGGWPATQTVYPLKWTWTQVRDAENARVRRERAAAGYDVL